MNAFSSPLLLTCADRVGWAILHSCWLGSINAIALAGALRLLRDAALRHLACMCALILTVAGTIAVTTHMSTRVTAPVARSPDNNLFSEAAMGAPSRGGALSSVPIVAPSRTYSDSFTASPVWEARPSTRFTVRWQQLAAPAFRWVSAIWLVGVILLSVRHFGGWSRVHCWRQTAQELVQPEAKTLASLISTKLRLHRLIPIMASTEVATPMLVGIMRPIVLLPLRVVTGFSALELEAILAHELAHFARGDAWANLLQLIGETLLFYHPAVWWMGKRARIERENAADDLATAVCTDRVQYAHALARLAEDIAGPRLALAANDGTLFIRIRRLLIAAPREKNASHGWTAGALLLGGVFCTTAWMILRLPLAAADAPPAKERSAPAPSSATSPGVKPPAELSRKAPEDRKSWIGDAFQLEDKARREAAIEGIRAAMKSDNVDDARAGVTAFVRLGPIEFDKAAFRSEVRTLLASPDVPTRAAAATAFTMTGADADDVERILALADDPAAEVREPLTGIIVRLTKGDLTGKATSDAILKLMNNLPRDSRSVAHALWGAKFSPEIEARVLEFCGDIQVASNSNVGYNFLYGALSTQANKSDASCRRLIELLAHQDTTNIAGRSAWGLQQGVAPEQFALVADAMIKVLEARSDGYLRNNALRCLRTYGDARHAPALKTLLAKPGVTGDFRKVLEETVASLERRPVETSQESTAIVGPSANAPAVAKTKPSTSGESKSTGASVEKPEIEVEWRGNWWPAKVLKKEGERTFIHYIGYGSEWDEVVSAARIRPIQLKTAASETATPADPPPNAEAARNAQLVEQNRRAARLRAAEDRRHYSSEQLQEIETLYQVANTKGKRTAEAKASLKQLLEKYDKANRTGCATLYLGQASVGAERLEYLTRAVEKFSDCYYFNGCQVGGYGRYVLALTLWENGEKEKARALLGELKTTYKDATDHRGQPMGKIAEAVEKELATQQ